MVFVVSTGWVGRRTCLASKWTGVAEIASANWSLPESADVPSVHMLYPPTSSALYFGSNDVFLFVLLGYPIATYHAGSLPWFHHAFWTVIFSMGL